MSFPKLTPVNDALKTLLDDTKTPTEVETISLSQSINRVLAKAPISKINVPGFNNSAMDGYAINIDSLNNTDQLIISQRITAGSEPQPLAINTAARIFTGAPIPDGANAVVIQENTEIIEQNKVKLNNKVILNQNIRTTGEDIQAGSTILNINSKIRAQDIGLAASVGIKELTVYRKLKVAIFFTGDELTEPGENLDDGKIYNSNRYTIIGLLTQLNVEIIDLGNIKDDLEETKTALMQASQEADLIITTGGVSVGEEDHVKTAVEQLGKLKLWKISMKPGKPLAYGEISTTPFIGLPGNPVSAFVTFAIFARSIILKMQGRSNHLSINEYQIPADFNWHKPVYRQEYVRVKIVDSKAILYQNQGSGVLTSTSWADGLAIINEQTKINKGDLINYIPFNELFY